MEEYCSKARDCRKHEVREKNNRDMSTGIIELQHFKCYYSSTFFFHHIKSSNGVTDESNMSIEERASLLAAKYSSKYDKSKAADGTGSKLKREDSTDDLMKSIALAKERRAKRLEELMKVKY